MPVEISFFNRLYLRNGASWSPLTLCGQDDSFRTSIQIRRQNFKIRLNKKFSKFVQIFLSFFLLNLSNTFSSKAEIFTFSLTFLLKRILKFCQRIWILHRKLV